MVGNIGDAGEQVNESIITTCCYDSLYRETLVTPVFKDSLVCKDLQYVVIELWTVNVYFKCYLGTSGSNRVARS